MQSYPGPAFIVERLPRLLVPPCLAYFLSFISQNILDIKISTWIISLACFLSIPADFVATIWYTNYVNGRNAAALGAVSPPEVEAKSFGGLDLLTTLVDEFKRGYPGDVMLNWASKYGNTFNIRILFDNRIFTSEPEHIKAILATQFNDFEKGPESNSRVHSLLGTGVFNSDGDMWKFHRSMTRPFFHRERISDFDIFERHACDAIHQMKTRLKEGYQVDFQDLASRFTLDSATEFLFGNNVRSLSAGLPYPWSHSQSSGSRHPADIFADAFWEAQSKTAIRGRRGLHWPLYEPWKDEVKEHRKIVNDFIDPILADAVAKKRATRADGGDKVKMTADREVKDGETLLEHLVNYTEDHTILMDEILNIMIAGRDTTASTLTFAIYMLAENPSVLRRLREEILNKVGSSRRPTYDDIREMKYLRAVINETLRLYPAVPFNVRASNKATTWSSKAPGSKLFYIPPHTKCTYSVSLMHRRTDLWGPDALEFDPDRFLDERLHKYLTPNPFIFLPFNAGPRICLGQQFAYNETSFFLVRLLQSFSAISLAPDAQPPFSRPPASWVEGGDYKARERICPGTHLTMYVKGGLWLTMEEV